MPLDQIHVPITSREARAAAIGLIRGYDIPDGIGCPAPADDEWKPSPRDAMYWSPDEEDRS